jgi:branched-chain amino acid transport system ATP-binding protein
MSQAVELPVASDTGPPEDDFLRMEGVDAFYGHIQALRGVSLRVGRGEIVTLIGSNGAGKTTTLKTVSGLVRARKGQVVFDNEDISRVEAYRLVRRGIGHAPEGRRIFSRLTVIENLQMGGYTRSSSEISGELERVFGLFPVLAERRQQRGGSLSGGEQQMLAIGRALMSRPKLLLLDEPSLGLSPILVQQIFSIIGEINRQGMTILLVEQNAQQALKLAHRGYVLQSGQIILADTAANLAANVQVRQAYLGEI